MKSQTKHQNKVKNVYSQKIKSNRSSWDKADFEKWLKTFLKEDAEILDELAKR